MNPNSLANLRPIAPEHRKPNARKGTGHRAKIRLYMQGQTQGTFNGQTVTLTEEEWVIIKALEDAKKGSFRARDFLFNRLYGKPVETHRVTGKVTQEHVIGKSWADLSPEELSLIIANPECFEEREGMVVQAEFTEVENGESESSVTISRSTETRVDDSQGSSDSGTGETGA